MARPAVRNRPIPNLPPNVRMVPNPIRPGEQTPRFITPPSPDPPPTLPDQGLIKDTPLEVKQNWRGVIGSGRSPLSDMSAKDGEIFLKGLPATDYPRWEEARTEVQRCFYAMALCRLAHAASSIAVVDFKDKCGAASATYFPRATSDPPVPGGFILNCVNQILCVIQGTTTYQQQDYYLDNHNMTRVNYDLSVNSGTTPAGLGLWWEPFRPMAIVWRSRLAAALAANPGKPAIVIGTSAGAAIAELMVAGDLDVDESTEAVRPRKIVGGIGFGCPKQYGLQTALRFLSAPHMTIYDSVRDPIPLFPLSRLKIAPNWLNPARVNADSLLAFAQRRRIPGSADVNEPRSNPEFPRNYAELTDKVNRYHGISNYYAYYCDGLCNRSREGDSRWDSLKIDIRGLELTPFVERP